MTPERVVAGAEELADEVGLPAMTLAALAARLGVKLPSLYKHVSGMEALQREISLRAMTELGQVMSRAAAGKAGDAAVIALMAAARQWIKQHPGRYATTVRAASATDEQAVAVSEEALSVLMDVLAGYGLSGKDAVDGARAVRSVLHGFSTLEIAGGFGMPVDVDRSYDLLVQALCRSLGSWGSATPA
nr:TetR/AcrR family transcriptional regulator [Kineosporia babensis]